LELRLSRCARNDNKTIFHPPSQKATGVNPWMNAKRVALRSLGERGYASAGFRREASLYSGYNPVVIMKILFDSGLSETISLFEQFADRMSLAVADFKHQCAIGF